MDTQVLHLENGAPTTDPTRLRRFVPLIAVAAVFIILAAMGVYVVAFRSLPTTVTWAPSVSAIAPGGDIAVAGHVTPPVNGRHVSFESAATAKGPWKPMPQVAITDSHGRFAITLKSQFTGSIVMRAVVDPAGRYLQVIGPSKPVRLLTLSSISLKGGGLVTNQIPVSFAFSVNPPIVGRTVKLEQSSDKVHWVPIGPSAQTQADGKAAVKVSELAIGQWSYRATVAQDDRFAAALSPVVDAKVEDYKVVEARVAAEKVKAQTAAAAAEKAKAQAVSNAEAAKETASTDASPNKPNCPVDQGPISGNWCLHSANGPDNPGYVMQCEVPGVPKYQWPAAVKGKC